jgi:hypothetical protein
MSTTHLVRVEAAAARAEVSAKTVWRLLGDGHLTRYRQYGRTYVDSDELQGWINQRQAITAERVTREEERVRSPL